MPRKWDRSDRRIRGGATVPVLMVLLALGLALALTVSLLGVTGPEAIQMDAATFGLAIALATLAVVQFITLGTLRSVPARRATARPVPEGPETVTEVTTVRRHYPVRSTVRPPVARRPSRHVQARTVRRRSWHAEPRR